MKVVNCSVTRRPFVNEQCQDEIYTGGLKAYSIGPMLYAIKTTPRIYTKFREEHSLSFLRVWCIIYPLNATVIKLHWCVEMQKRDHFISLKIDTSLLWSCASALKRSPLSRDTSGVKSLKREKCFDSKWRQTEQNLPPALLFLFIHTTFHARQQCSQSRALSVKAEEGGMDKCARTLNHTLI